MISKSLTRRFFQGVWDKCLYNLTAESVCVLQEHDEPILKHLEDIKVKFSDPGQPMVSTSDSREEM